MAMTLPPVIRPYWSTLTAEKASAPAHRDWEWDDDPFKAKHEVEARQGKKKAKDEKASQNGNGNGEEAQNRRCGQFQGTDRSRPPHRDGDWAP